MEYLPGQWAQVSTSMMLFIMLKSICPRMDSNSFQLDVLNLGRMNIFLTPELLPELANYYQLLIGVLHWMVEIGQVDMITDVSKLASHMAMPREGHLQAMLHILGYLKKKHGLRMVFDPSYPDINHMIFKECDW
jgi:hypothetical protein